MAYHEQPPANGPAPRARQAPSGQVRSAIVSRRDLMVRPLRRPAVAPAAPQAVYPARPPQPVRALVAPDNLGTWLERTVLALLTALPIAVMLTGFVLAR